MTRLKLYRDSTRQFIKGLPIVVRVPTCMKNGKMLARNFMKNINP